VSTNPNDSDNYKAIVALKEENSGLKVLFSVGGPLTPSHTWSTLAADAGSRAAFVTAAKAMIVILTWAWISPGFLGDSCAS